MDVRLSNNKNPSPTQLHSEERITAKNASAVSAAEKALAASELKLSRQKAALDFTWEKLTHQTADLAWSRLERWRPNENKTISENILELRELYFSLREYILTKTDQAQQLSQLQRLQALVRNHLDTLAKSQYGDLTQFLTANKQSEGSQVVTDSLAFLVFSEKTASSAPDWRETMIQIPKTKAGDNRDPLAVSPPSAEKDSNAENRAAQHSSVLRQSATVNGMTQYNAARVPYGDAPPAASSLHTEETSAAVSELMNLLKENSKDTGVVLDYSKDYDVSKTLFPQPFTLEEMTAANAFAKHILLYDSALPKTVAGIEKEEWIGLQSASLWLKAQLFTESRGISQAMGRIMQSSVENVIFQSIYHSSDLLKKFTPETPQEKELFPPLRRDVVFLVYNYILMSYRETRDAKKSLMEGIFYALEMLQKKDADPFYQLIYRYRRPPESDGSIFSWINNEKLRVQLLKRSWNQFIKDMKLKLSLSLDFTRLSEQYSLWLQQKQPPAPAFVSPAKPVPPPESSKSAVLWFLATGAAISAMLLFQMMRQYL